MPLLLKGQRSAWLFHVVFHHASDLIAENLHDHFPHNVNRFVADDSIARDDM